MNDIQTDWGNNTGFGFYPPIAALFPHSGRPAQFGNESYEASPWSANFFVALLAVTG